MNLHTFPSLPLLAILLMAPSIHAEANHAHSDEAAPGIALTQDQARAHGIKTATVGPAALTRSLTFPGELRLDDTRTAQVVTRVPGVLERLNAAEGDAVRHGDPLARLVSRTAAEAIQSARTARLRARRAHALAEEESALAERRATSAREAREARLAAEEAEADAQGALQQLRALGLDIEASEPTERILTAPIDGVVLTRRATVGAAVTGEETLFEIADLSHLWADLRTEPEMLEGLRPGQRVTLLPSGAEGTLRWIGPTVEDSTRTVRLRAEIPNPTGTLRPGAFIEGRITLPGRRVAMAVANEAIQRGADGHPVVFVRHDEGTFEPREVTLGAHDATHTEVLSGLTAGEVYAVQGAFVLKAESLKGSFGDGHNH